MVSKKKTTLPCWDHSEEGRRWGGAAVSPSFCCWGVSSPPSPATPPSASSLPPSPPALGPSKDGMSGPTWGVKSYFSHASVETVQFRAFIAIEKRFFKYLFFLLISYFKKNSFHMHLSRLFNSGAFIAIEKRFFKYLFFFFFFCSEDI